MLNERPSQLTVANDKPVPIRIRRIARIRSSSGKLAAGRALMPRVANVPKNANNRGEIPIADLLGLLRMRVSQHKTMRNNKFEPFAATASALEEICGASLSLNSRN